MNVSTLLLLIAALAIAGYYQGSSRAVTVATPLGGVRRLPSLPSHYGAFVALMVLLPALAAMTLWSLASAPLIERMVLASLPASHAAGDTGLLLNSIANRAAGVSAGAADPVLASAAELMAALEQRSRLGMWGLVMVCALLGGLYGWRKVRADFVARNAVERIFTRALLACASVAVLTTIGILLSVLVESLRFFQMVSPVEFLFGLRVEPADRAARGPAGLLGALRRGAAVRRHAADLGDRACWWRCRSG